jgi:hypothetical protein
MHKASEATRLHSQESAISTDNVSRLVGISLSAGVAAGFWTWVVWITGASIGHQPETGTLEMIAVAVAAVVTIALTALPTSAE